MGRGGRERNAKMDLLPVEKVPFFSEPSASVRRSSRGDPTLRPPKFTEIYRNLLSDRSKESKFDVVFNDCNWKILIKIS